MKHIILVTHAGFAEGILSSLQLVMGDLPGIGCVSISAQETIEEIVDMIRRKRDALGSRQQTVIISDIAGGSTTRAALEIAAAESGIYVITGLNLALLLEIAMTELDEDEAGNRRKLLTAVENSKAMMYLVDQLPSGISQQHADDEEL